MRYGIVLEEMLNERDIRPAELAEAIGKSRSYVSQLINGQIVEPRLSIAVAIADYLDVDLYEMIERMESESAPCDEE